MQKTDILAHHWRPHPDAFTDSGPDGTFMLTPDGQMMRMNPVAEYIWINLDGNRTAQEILTGILAEFAVPSRDQAEADLMGFLQALEQVGLVEKV